MVDSGHKKESPLTGFQLNLFKIGRGEWEVKLSLNPGSDLKHLPWLNTTELLLSKTSDDVCNFINVWILNTAVNPA